MKINDLKIEDISSRLMISVMNYENSKDIISSYPHLHRGEFGIVSQICIGNKNEHGLYDGCLTVTNSHLDHWGISNEQLFELAAMNTNNLFTPMYFPLNRFMDSNVGLDLKPHSGCVITNSSCWNGSSVLFGSDIFSGIYYTFDKEKEWALLPMSDEIIALRLSNYEIEDIVSIYDDIRVKCGGITENILFCDLSDELKPVFSSFNGEVLDTNLTFSDENVSDRPINAGRGM